MNLNRAVPETDKLASLRELLSAVQANTKREMEGRQSNPEREMKLLMTHIELIIGRKPDPATMKIVRYC